MTMTDEQKRQAAETRRRNQEAKAARWEAEAEAINSARLALQRVFESQDASPAEILRAGELLVELGKR